MDTAYASMVVKGLLCALPYLLLLVLFVAGHYGIKKWAGRKR